MGNIAHPDVHALADADAHEKALEAIKRLRKNIRTLTADQYCDIVDAMKISPFKGIVPPAEWHLIGSTAQAGCGMLEGEFYREGHPLHWHDANMNMMVPVDAVKEAEHVDVKGTNWSSKWPYGVFLMDV